MNSENNSNTHWPDPKDYGLPIVDIKPIRIIPVESSIEVVSSKDVEVLKEEVDPSPEIQSIDSVKSDELKAVETPVPVMPMPKIAKSIPAKKQSKSWIGVTAVLALLIVAVIIWQMTASNNEVESVVAIEAAAIQSPTISEDSNSSVNDSKVTEIQDSENQSSITELPSSPTTPIQNPETGTTIDPTAAGTLIRVESKAARPTYFIIVGSLPNERLALEEAPQYQNRVPALYLITPYDDTRNYRLAIGSFGSFTKANEELERIKADYTEALWILKY